MTRNKFYRYDVAILRVLCITVVVFFHGYGMLYANHFGTDTAEFFRQKYSLWVSGGPINVAMPLFVFISGFLFGGQLLKSQPVSFVKMAKSKFLRLIVPFFVFAVAFMLLNRGWQWEVFYQWTYWHLWFLPMLFWCFIVTYFLRPLIMRDNLVVSLTTLTALFLISSVGKVVPMIVGLHNVSVWLCWFAAGAWWFKHEHLIAAKAYKISMILMGGGVLA